MEEKLAAYEAMMLAEAKKNAESQEEDDTLGDLGSDEEEDAETETKVVEGVEYNYDPESNMIIDPNDNSHMGEWDEEEQEIIFVDDEAEEKHRLYCEEA